MPAPRNTSTSSTWFTWLSAHHRLVAIIALVVTIGAVAGYRSWGSSRALRRAEAFLSLGYPELAAQTLEPWIAARSTQAPWAITYAKSLILSAQYPKAVVTTQHYLVHAGDQPVIRLMLADAHRLSGACPRALPEYDRILKTEERLFEGYLGLAACLATLKRTNDAIRILEQGVKILPQNPQLLRELAAAYQQTGKQAEAEALQKTLAELEKSAAARR